MSEKPGNDHRSSNISYRYLAPVTRVKTLSTTSAIGIPVVSMTTASGATASGDAARVESLLSRSASAVAT
jgi:hypothetical protein